jgi:hypothetical protein
MTTGQLNYGHRIRMLRRQPTVFISVPCVPCVQVTLTPLIVRVWVGVGRRFAAFDPKLVR